MNIKYLHEIERFSLDYLKNKLISVTSKYVIYLKFGTYHMVNLGILIFQGFQLLS